MATFYIDFSSSTNGVGSLADPYNTIPSTLTTNDTYLLKCNTSGVLSTAPTIQAGVVLSIYGTGNIPEIKCRVGTGTDPIRINSGTLTINNIQISGEPGFNRNLVVSGGSPSSKLILNNCSVVRNLNGGGVGVASYNAGGELELNNTFVAFTNGDNVNASSKAILRNCYLYAPGLDATTANGDNIQFSNAAAGASSGSILENNVFSRFGSQITNQKQCVINQDSSATSFIVKNNIFYSPNPPEEVSSLFVAVPNAIIQGNYFVGGRNAINIDSSCVVSGNIFVGQISTAIRCLDATGSENIKLYNNLFMNQNVAITRPTSGSAVIEDTNNIYFNCVTKYLNSGGTLNTLTSFTGDPLLKSGFFPTNPSVIGTGTSVNAYDFYGFSLLLSPNIGPVKDFPSRSVVTSRGVVG